MHWIHSQAAGCAKWQRSAASWAASFAILSLSWTLGFGNGAVTAHENRPHNQGAKQIVGNFLKDIDSQSCQIPEAQLLSVKGEPVQFHEDFVKAKTVAISFVYTRCTNVCSPIAANVGVLRDILGKRVGQDVQLISISIDPKVDTPEILEKWSQPFQPGNGWVFLTGKKHRIDRLLKGLKVFTPNIEDHPPIMIVANDQTGDCVYTNGLAAPEQLRQIIENLSGEAVKDGGKSE
jgi:protein SCO1/2